MKTVSIISRTSICLRYENNYILYINKIKKKFVARLVTGITLFFILLFAQFSTKMNKNKTGKNS